MKKFSFVLALLVLFTTTACCKKNEPKPLPPTPAPIVLTGSIVLTMPEASADRSEYTFDLQISGTDIEEKGVNKKENKKDSQGKEYFTYTASAGMQVVFSGKIERFNITEGQIEKADLSQAPATLKVFGMRGTKTTSIDLTGAKELTYLIYRNQNTKEIDLSQQNKVTYMELGKERVGNNGTMQKVIMPSPSEVEVLNISDENISDIDLSNLPKLRSLRAFGVKAGKIDLRNSPMLEEAYFTQGSPDIKYEYFRTKNTPKLFRVFMQHVPFEEVSIENAPKLGNGGKISSENITYAKDKKLPLRSGYDQIEGFYINGGSPRKSLTLNGTAITKFTENTKPTNSSLELLNLSGNKLIEASLAGFTALKEVDFSSNELTNEAMNSIANELPQATGIFKAKNAMAGGAAFPTDAEQTIRSKGWNIAK